MRPQQPGCAGCLLPVCTAPTSPAARPCGTCAAGREWHGERESRHCGGSASPRSLPPGSAGFVRRALPARAGAALPNRARRKEPYQDKSPRPPSPGRQREATAAAVAAFITPVASLNEGLTLRAPQVLLAAGSPVCPVHLLAYQVAGQRLSPSSSTGRPQPLLGLLLTGVALDSSTGLRPGRQSKHLCRALCKKRCKHS